MFLSLVDHLLCCLCFGCMWLRFALLVPSAMSRESGCLCSSKVGVSYLVGLVGNTKDRPEVGYIH